MRTLDIYIYQGGTKLSDARASSDPRIDYAKKRKLLLHGTLKIGPRLPLTKNEEEKNMCFPEYRNIGACGHI
jgi:hypothetical protein